LSNYNNGSDLVWLVSSKCENFSTLDACHKVIGSLPVQCRRPPFQTTDKESTTVSLTTMVMDNKLVIAQTMILYRSSEAPLREAGRLGLSPSRQSPDSAYQCLDNISKQTISFYSSFTSSAPRLLRLPPRTPTTQSKCFAHLLLTSSMLTYHDIQLFPSTVTIHARATQIGRVMTRWETWRSEDRCRETSTRQVAWHLNA